MPRSTTRVDPELEAEKLLRNHNVTEAPIPVEEVARSAGATVVHRRFDGNDTAGFMYSSDEGVLIGVNSATSRKRQRFTVAHEIGHMLLHRSDDLRVDSVIQFRDGVSTRGTDPNEREANAFAASLLMPTPLVEQHLASAWERGTTARETLVAQLANEFDVSTEAMTYRLINLGVLRA